MNQLSLYRIHGLTSFCVDPSVLAMTPRSPSGLGSIAKAVRVCLLLAVFFPACDSGNRTPVIFISLDTLRSDHVGCYGHPVGSTPTLDRLARDSVLCENAFSQMPFTPPSHMSMFTGFYPDVFGVIGKGPVLPSGIHPIAEVLQEAGYQTVGFGGTHWLKHEYGFGRGFTIYDLMGAPDLQYADRINSAAHAWLDQFEEKRGPPFLFLHYYDPHMDTQGAFGNRYPYFSMPTLRKRFAGISQPGEWCARGKCATKFLIHLEQNGISLDRVRLRRLHGLYDGGIYYTDTAVEKLLRELARKKLYHRSLVVLTSDHGVEFGEHGRYIHNQTYDENLAIPLLVKLPAQQSGSRIIHGFVETVDFLPTILELLKVKDVQDRQGRSFATELSGMDAADGGKRVVFSRKKPSGIRHAVRDYTHKMIRNADSGAMELYDLRVDPLERHDCSGQRPEKLAELEEILDRYLLECELLAQKYPVTRDVDPLNQKEKEELEALGYVGS